MRFVHLNSSKLTMSGFFRSRCCRCFWLSMTCYSFLTANLTESACPEIGTCNVNICVLIADLISGKVAYRKYASTIDIAISDANSQLRPSNITLRKFYLPETPQPSGQCVSACAVTRALAMLAAGANCHVFLGPDTPYSVNGVYGLAYTNSIPILSTAAYGIASRKFASLLTLLFLNTKDMAQFLVKYLTFRNYTYVAVLHDQSDGIFVSLGEEFYTAYSDFYSKANHTEFRITSLQFHKDLTTDSELQVSLNYARTKARVIVVFTFFKTFKKLLMLADELGMIEEFRYVTTHPYDDPYYGSTDLSQLTPDQMPVLKILQGNINVISLKLFSPPAFWDFQEKAKRLAQEQYNYTFSATDKIDPLVTAHYDAVMLLASVIKKLEASGDDMVDGIKLASSMKRCEYRGLQTGVVRIDETGDSQLSYDVYGVAVGSNKFTPIWAYEADTDKFRNLRPTTGNIVENIPRCGFSGESTICREEKEASVLFLKVSLLAALSALVFVALVAWVSFRTIRRLKLQLNQNWWKVELSELQFPTRSRSSSEHGNNCMLLSHPPYTMTSAVYRGIEVELVDVTSFRVTMTPLHRLVNNDHLQRFIGISLDKSWFFVWLVFEQCSKGDLSSFLANGNFKLDWGIKNSFIRDLAQGMMYLQSTAFISHGNLNSHNCRIDGRLTLKISGYGISYLRPPEDLAPLTTDSVKRNYQDLLWRAPELLSVSMRSNGTQKGDIYSFGIILQQIILENDPYGISTETASATIYDILINVRKSSVPPMRPSVPRSACSAALYELVNNCWSEHPNDRPSFERVCDNLKKTLGGLKGTIVDQLVKRMEDYSSNLEAKTLQLVDEKRKSDDLLCMILPKSVAAALIRGDTVEPESYESVSIYFSDVVGFTIISAELTPLKVVAFLNALYTIFDKILQSYDVYKVETIGDAYMIASGLPLRNGQRHVTEICTVALHLRDEMFNFHVPGVTKGPGGVKVRIGLNTGACVAGVVGLKMPRYCLFGDTVNTASRMESTGEPMKIHISQSTKDCLESVGGFTVSRRGEVEVKGKGIMTTFWLISKIFHDNRNC